MTRRGKEPIVESDTISEFSTDASEDATDVGGSKDTLETSPNFNVWGDPFHLGRLGPNIRSELIRRAPFLLGSDCAHYDVSFFKEVGGLCDEGIAFRKLKEDQGVPLEELLPTYPVNRAENRHPIKLMDAAEAAHALRMYQRVYGGNQPDNGEFGTAFVRGLRLEAKKKKVNWAEGAADLAKTRGKNHVCNPGKLTPPCVREQIQGMLDAASDLLARAKTAHAAAVKQLKDAKIPISADARLVGVTKDDASARARHRTSSKKPPQDRRAVKDLLPPPATVSRQPRTHRSKTREKKSEKNRAGALMKKRAAAEAALADIGLELQQAEGEWARRQEKQLEIAKKEEGHWEEFAAIQQAKKEKEMDPVEKGAVDRRLRAAMASAAATSNALNANECELSRWSLQVSNLQSKSLALQTQ